MTSLLCNGTIRCTFSSHRLVHNKLTRCCATKTHILSCFRQTGPLKLRDTHRLVRGLHQAAVQLWRLRAALLGCHHVQAGRQQQGDQGHRVGLVHRRPRIPRLWYVITHPPCLIVHLTLVVLCQHLTPKLGLIYFFYSY